jgi:hypothetical protein
MNTIYEWQQEFRKQPLIYYIQIEGEVTGNFYFDEEGAKLEKDFLGKKARICKANIHSFDLAKRRWNNKK